MIKNFCHLCGTSLKQESTDTWFCPICDATIYANPKPCVDVALFDDSGKILMAKRAAEPDKGKLDFPGGFMDINETAEQALYRELKEELELEPEDLGELTYVGSRTHDYPFGKEVHKNIVFVFCAKLIAPKAAITAGDDVAEVQFYEVDQLTVPLVASEEQVDFIHRAAKVYRSTQRQTGSS